MRCYYAVRLLMCVKLLTDLGLELDGQLGGRSVMSKRPLAIG